MITDSHGNTLEIGDLLICHTEGCESEYGLVVSAEDNKIFIYFFIERQIEDFIQQPYGTFLDRSLYETEKIC